MPPNDLPSFLPTQLPADPVLDLSNTLDATSLQALNSVAAGVGYSPKVVVLPKNYSCPDARQLTLELAQRWGVNGEGKTLLLVVDLNGHKVRAHCSPELNNVGVTSDYITNTLIPRQFVPYMRKGDLASAVRLTVLEIDKVQRQGSTAPQSLTAYSPTSNVASTPEYSTNPPPGLVTLPPFPIFPIIAILAAGSCAMIFGHRYMKLSDNKKEYSELQIRMDTLFSKTDKLGQAADFLDSKTHANLCHEIADFFAKITTLQNAQAQVESLLKQGIRSNGQAWRAISRCRQYVGSMEIMATDLLRRVEAATGTKHSYEPNGSINVASPAARTEPPIRTSVSAGNSNGAMLKIGYRPRWSSDPVYARTVDDDPLQTISTYVVEKERAALPVSDYRESPKAWFTLGSSDGGGSWSGGDSSSGSSSDGGGSWDSGSSSSDSSSGASSDGGGSW